MTRRRVTVVLGLLLAAALLWWALRDVSLVDVLRHLREADVGLLLAAVAVATGTFVLRAVRWRLLLLPALDSSPFRSRFAAVCIGFMGNNLLPARLGEFARVYAFSRTEPIGMSATFASLVVERLMDGLALVVLLLPALLLAELSGWGQPALFRQVFVVAAAIVAVALVVFSLVVRFPDAVLRFSRGPLHRFLPEAAAERVAAILHSFISGLGALRHGHLFARVFAWTLVIWVWNGASFWLGFLAFDIGAPGFSGALLLQSVIGFAVSIPSSPGFFGPFEAAARFVLVAFEVEPTRIISFAAGYHLLSFIPVTVLGLWYAHRLGISLAEVERSEEYVEAEVEREAEAGGAAEAGPPRESRREPTEDGPVSPETLT